MDVSSLLSSLIEQRTICEEKARENKLSTIKNIFESIWSEYDTTVEIMTHVSTISTIECIFNVIFDNNTYYVSFYRYNKPTFMQNFTVMTTRKIVSLNISNINGLEYNNNDVLTENVVTDDMYCNIIINGMMPYLQHCDNYFI